VQGVFESYFMGKPSPFEVEPETGEGGTDAQPTPGVPPDSSTPPIGTIEASPESARLVVIGSAEFLNDTVFDLSATLTRDRYLNSLAFMQNIADWSVEDLDLLDIRTRGSSVRVLSPLTEEEQSFWEVANYVLALLALLGVGLVWRWQRRNEEPLSLKPVSVPVEKGEQPSAGGARSQHYREGNHE
jgi:ABC-2 type transport system permease protein